MSLEHSPSRGGRAAFTISEFCEDNRISRSTLYKMWEAGNGPRTMRVGAKVLITAEASAAWRAQMEAASNPQAA